jgi:hypothetical protein
MENFFVTVAPQVSLLAGAESAGVILPSSCRNGTCRTAGKRRRALPGGVAGRQRRRTARAAR